MAAKVFLLVAVAVVSRAQSQDLQIPGFTVHNHANPVAVSNRLLDIAYYTRKSFIDYLINVPERYNWGYQLTEPTEGEVRSQYESRDGDLIHGSFSVLKTDHTGATLYYTVDDVNKTISALRMERDIVRLHVPVTLPKNDDKRATDLIDDDPLVVEATSANDAFSHYFRNALPKRYSFTYDVHDPVNGTTTSHFQSLYDSTPGGSYTLAKSDGSSRTIYYSIDGKNKLTPERAEVTEAKSASSTSDTETPAQA